MDVSEDVSAEINPNGLNASRLVLLSQVIFCCRRKSRFDSTALYSLAAVIFGRLPGTVMLQYNLAH